MITRIRTALPALAIAMACAAPVAIQAQTTEIKVSYQPALYWALPFFSATEKNRMSHEIIFSNKRLLKPALWGFQRALQW